MHQTPLPVTVAIIAHREQERIPVCINSVRNWAREVVVVVQTEDDPTRAVAEQLGAQVQTRPWTNYRDQREFALSLVSTPWALMLDADESVSDSLREALAEFVRSDPPAFDAAEVQIRDLFLGRLMAYGELRDHYSIRLVRKGRVTLAGGLIHEHVLVDGKTARLEGWFIHRSNPSTSTLSAKVSRYANLFVAQRVAVGDCRASIAEVVLRPSFRFLRNYVFRRGFLDGYPGFLYAAFMAYYTFLRYARMLEYSRNPAYRTEIGRLLRDSGTPGTPRQHGADRIIERWRKNRGKDAGSRDAACHPRGK